MFDQAAGQPQVQRDADLAPHAGLLVLQLAVLGVAAAGHRLLRFEPADGGRWHAVARSPEALLPDARPLQAELDGRGDGGHIVMLAGPDAQRYRHGVLGDAVEAARAMQAAALADDSAWVGLLDDGLVLLAPMNTALPSGRR